MKAIIEQSLQHALNALSQLGIIPNELNERIVVDRTKDQTHGDFATNIALVLAKKANLAPRVLAEHLIKTIKPHPLLLKIELAGPGFINFFLVPGAQMNVVNEILTQKDAFGASTFGHGKKVLLEFVSANPTGPLHVGHGRSAAFGASLANLLTLAGFSVVSEYYVNDAGRQMDILAVSVWLRYLVLTGESIVFPENAYQGDYVVDIAQDILNQFGPIYAHSWQDVMMGLSAQDDKDAYIDALILRAKALLSAAGFATIHQCALGSVLKDIQEDLREFGVVYDDWYSEQSLFDKGAIQKGIEALTKAGHTYEQQGALWFKATDFGDEKDRVLVRANGQATYFASDVAYHWDKYARGFDRVIDVFGADHHGYITRIKSAVHALGHDADALDVLLVQFAILYRHGERVQMSTRSGSFVTLRELRQEVGCDAARFFYVARKSEQHMDFDLDLAKSQSSDNPVYYIQYAHARICSVMRQLQERQLDWHQEQGLASLHLLVEPHEISLMNVLSQYPEMIESAAKACEPHQVAYYLRDLAQGLHGYYNALPLICEEASLRNARLTLLEAVRCVLNQGLLLLGVNAPERM